VRDVVIELVLVGVVRHTGKTPQEGHYFAVVKDFEDISCWLCDDRKVSKTTESIFLGEYGGNPVLLFYIRKEVLESERKQKRQSSQNIPLEKRTSDRLRQRTHRTENSKEAAEKVRAGGAARRQDQRAALPQKDRQNDRAANTASHRERRAALPEGDRQIYCYILITPPLAPRSCTTNSMANIHKPVQSITQKNSKAIQITSYT
jgi:hypothetical protein